MKKNRKDQKKSTNSECVIEIILQDKMLIFLGDLKVIGKRL